MYPKQLQTPVWRRRVRFLLLAGVLIAAAACVLHPWRMAPPAEAPAAAARLQTPAPCMGPEVMRKGLTLREGRYYRPGEAKAFNGVMMERYPNGAPLYRCGVSNGLIDGLSQGWYTNGQLQVEEHFRAGVSHGLRVKWHENGAKLSQASIVNGKIEGVFHRWYENGVLAEEINLRAGNPDGRARAFYPSGCLKAEAQMKDGKPIAQKQWADGESRVPGGASP